MSSPNPTRELAPAYDPSIVERPWYARWESGGVFRAEWNGEGDPFVITIPPPNVTGVLHMGHVLNHTLQDLLARWKRMEGRPTLFLPGTDHAGIATQNMVKKKLASEGRDWQALGRDAFVAETWAWKERCERTIVEQMKRLGESCDWSRYCFTLDPGLSSAVTEVFVALYERGLIYRGKRLINWCPVCRTALSDEEVEHEEVSGISTTSLIRSRAAAPRRSRAPRAARMARTPRSTRSRSRRRVPRRSWATRPSLCIPTTSATST